MIATAQEVAQELRVCTRTVHRMAKDGTIKRERWCKVGGRWRFDLEGIRRDFLGKK